MATFERVFSPFDFKVFRISPVVDTSVWIDCSLHQNVDILINARDARRTHNRSTANPKRLSLSTACVYVDLSQGPTANLQGTHNDLRTYEHRSNYDARSSDAFQVVYLRMVYSQVCLSIFQQCIHINLASGLDAPDNILPCKATGRPPRDDAQASIVYTMSGHHEGGKKMLHRFA